VGYKIHNVFTLKNELITNHKLKHGLFRRDTIIVEVHRANTAPKTRPRMLMRTIIKIPATVMGTITRTGGLPGGEGEEGGSNERSNEQVHEIDETAT
jgi:hypothetical protein